MKVKNNRKNFKIIKLMIIVVIIIIYSVWLTLACIDLNNCQNRKAPIYSIKKINHQYENGYINEYICFGYKIVEYQLINKKNVWEYGTNYAEIDTANLVDKYLLEHPYEE